jgi:hypothetical protein
MQDVGDTYANYTAAINNVESVNLKNKFKGSNLYTEVLGC